MGLLIIDFRTNIPPNQLSHIDITLIHRIDIRQNEYTIIPSIPEGNLRTGVRLLEIDNLEEGQIYRLVLRLFLNRQTVLLREYSIQMARETCSGYWFWRRCSTNATIVIVTV